MRISDWSSDVCSFDLIAVSGKRPEREVVAIAMIAQIEDTGKTDGGEPRLVPFGAVARRVQQKIDAAPHGIVLDLARRHEGENRPGGLGWRAGFGLDRKSTRLNSSH